MRVYRLCLLSSSTVIGIMQVRSLPPVPPRLTYGAFTYGASRKIRSDEELRMFRWLRTRTWSVRLPLIMLPVIVVLYIVQYYLYHGSPLNYFLLSIGGIVYFVILGAIHDAKMRHRRDYYMQDE